MAAGLDTRIQLTILRQGDLNIVDVAELGSLIPRSETHVDDAFLQDLASETAHLAAAVRAGGPAAADALERVGGLVFSHLLTEPARARLRDAEPTDLYLRLDERLVHVPWELCHDGRDFLATKFRLGRQVITSRAIPERAPARQARDRLRVLLVADPTETLPQASREVEHLCGVLDSVPSVDVTLLAGRSVRRIPLLAALREHDVVHYAGHSRYDAATPGRSGWQLADGVLTAAEIAKLRPAPALVFSNSCEAGASPAWDAGGAYEGHAFGIGSAFLLAGVRNYVGTFWVVHDEESLRFASTCYRALATGASLGHALLDARHAIVAQRGWQGLTWASYLLYGDPAFVPLPEGATLPMPPPIAATAPSREYRYAVSVSAESQTAHATPVVPAASTSHVVGRASDLDRLGQALARVRQGARSVVFVSGPPGIGKTTVVDAFLERARARGEWLIARGQSVERYGAGEAYLPVLEAWAKLARESGGALVEQLRRYAPTWLAQLPVLLDPAEHAALQQRAQNATRERMLREMAELLEAVTAEHPTILVLEDLHWSDRSTLELVAYLAQRREPARLFVVGTFRSAEAKRGDSALRAVAQELLSHGRAEQLRLRTLESADVGAYVRSRLATGRVDDDVADAIHRRTEGHPLFLVNTVDFALREGILNEDAGRWRLHGGADALASGVPDSLRQMIERQLETLPDEDRQALEAGSVVGAEFSVAAVAAALQADAEMLDDRCEGLAWTGQFVTAAGVEEWPDGTMGGRYRFVHSLYRDVTYARVAPARRARMHRRIAERKVVAFGPRAAEIAGELSAHFEAARDVRQAVTYRTLAGDNAVMRLADREAIAHFTKALQQLEGLPETAERAALELGVQVKLATPLMSTRGYAAPEVACAFERAHALSRQVAGGPHLFPLLRGLVSFYQVRGQHPRARDVGEELLALCERSEDRIAHVQAHYGHGVTLYDLVKLDESLQHLERALALYDAATHPTHVSVYGGYDPGVACRAWMGWVHWLRGTPDQAARSVERSVALAERLGHPFSMDFAYLAAATVRLFRGETHLALPHLERAAEISRQEGFAYQRAIGASLEGWASITMGRPDDAIAQLEEALAGYEATGAAVARPGILALLAVATAMRGNVPEGLRHVTRGLEEAERTTQQLHVVQLHVTRGDLLLWSGGADQAAAADACYRQALGLARGLRAPMLELRPAMRLAALLNQQGRTDEARALLGPVVEQFSEGLELRDLRNARTLLAS